jgi:hypothetical protein
VCGACRSRTSLSSASTWIPSPTTRRPCSVGPSQSEAASLDSQGVVDAIVANPVARPEAAAYDFRENQLPEFPDMAGFRIFTREVVILELQDGEYQVVSDGFVDMLHPPTLE